jgi:hypothetical protein
MKIVFYLLTLICGLIGLLGFIRMVELLVFGGSFNLAQLPTVVVSLFLAWFFLRKARNE